MELGFNDDDFFDIPNERGEKKNLVSYNAKVLEPNWFDTESISPDDPESRNKLRYSGDNAMRSGRYELALDRYQQCLSQLSEKNITVWRDLNEAIALCHAHLKDSENAVQLARSVCEKAITYEQKTSAWYTTSRVHQMLDIPQGEIVFLQALALLHNSNPRIWRRLGELYACTSGLSATPTTIPPILKQVYCFTKTKVALGRMFKNSVGFMREKNQSDQLEIKAIISSLCLETTLLEKIEQQIRHSDMEDEFHPKDSQLTDHQKALQIDPLKEDITEEFESKEFTSLINLITKH